MESVMTRRLLTYMAHPFGGRLELLDEAERLLADLQREYTECVILAPWIPLCRHWPDSGESRRLGLDIDMSAVAASDAVMLVGGEHCPERLPTPGMEREIRCAQNRDIPIIDLLGMPLEALLSDGTTGIVHARLAEILARQLRL